MGRAIVVAPSDSKVRSAFPALAADSPQQEKPDTYRERLFKYIPAEVVTLYVGLNTILASAKDAPHFLSWVIFFVCLIGTPYYLRQAQNVTAPMQLMVSTAAFAVWIFALGGPFTGFHWYQPVYGALLLPTFTFFVARFSPAPPKQSQQDAPK